MGQTEVKKSPLPGCTLLPPFVWIFPVFLGITTGTVNQIPKVSLGCLWCLNEHKHHPGLNKMLMHKQTLQRKVDMKTTIIKKVTDPKITIFIIYSPACHSKTVW